MWKKAWWIFGYWYPFGHTSSKITNIITDESVSKLLFDSLLTRTK
jgi:hypothetical protein